MIDVKKIVIEQSLTVEVCLMIEVKITGLSSRDNTTVIM